MDHIAEEYANKHKMLREQEQRNSLQEETTKNINTWNFCRTLLKKVIGNKVEMVKPRVFLEGACDSP